jgi:general secretion pathway protein C
MISSRTLLTTGQLVLLVVAAFLSASTVNALVAGRFRPHPSLAVSAPPAQAPVSAKHPLAYYQAITTKDVFNPPRAEPEPQAAQVTPLQAKLLGTAPGAGIDSYAIIEDDTSKTQELYRVGDKLQNRTLAKVEWDRVVLKSGQAEEVLEIVKPAGKPGAAAPVAASSGGGIEKRSETDYAIDRAEVDKSLENMNQLFTQIRAVPHFQDGKAAGFRLFAIKQDSVFEKIGLKNGDIINRINGQELTDPARAMSLIQELRNEGRITVDVSRNRQPTTLSYEIR